MAKCFHRRIEMVKAHAADRPSRKCHAHARAHYRGCSAVEHSLGAAAACTRRRPRRHSPRESGARHRLGAAGPSRRSRRTIAWSGWPTTRRSAAHWRIATIRPTARHQPPNQWWLDTRWSATHCWPATGRRVTTCRFTARSWPQSIPGPGPCAWSRARAKPQLDRRSGS